VTVVDVDEPEGPGAVVAMRSVSICASDLGYIGMGSTFLLGHELAGVTEDGTPVAIEAIFGCDACELCLEGRYNLCARGTTALGVTSDGGMSEYFAAPTRSLVALPAGLDVADACLVEPTAVAAHACRLTGVGPDLRVAVVGGGAIGLMAVAAATARGAAEVSLEARYPHQIELGERLGATQPSGYYDVVIEAAGSQSALHRATELARARRVRTRRRVAAAPVLPQGAAHRAVARVLPPRSRSRLRGRRRAPGRGPRPRRRARHAPVPAGGRGRGVPGRGGQVERRAAGGGGTVSGSGSGSPQLGAYFHVGIVVPDLDAAQAHLTALLGTEWGPVVETDLEVRDRDGTDLVVANRMCYSTQAPYLELIQEVPGSPWVCNEHSNLHHIGFFSGALVADAELLRAAACPLEWMDGHGDGPPTTFTYHRDPLGVRVELVDAGMRETMEQLMFRPPEA
jgi:hypothetical protein